MFQIIHFRFRKNILRNEKHENGKIRYYNLEINVVNYPNKCHPNKVKCDQPLVFTSTTQIDLKFLPNMDIAIALVIGNLQRGT